MVPRGARDLLEPGAGSERSGSGRAHVRDSVEAEMESGLEASSGASQHH